MFRVGLNFKMAAACSNTVEEFSLPYILKLLHPPPDWFDLGRELNIGQRKLEKIAVQHLAVGKEKCLEEVLEQWLGYDSAGQDALVEALKAIGRPDLAKALTNPSVIDLPDETIGVTKNVDVDSDYLTGIENTPSMVSLDRTFGVLKECTDLQHKFNELIARLQRELHPLSLSKIRRFVAREIVGFTYQKRPTSVEQLIASIHNHFCYLNHRIIDAVISEFLPMSGLGPLLKQFDEELKRFCNMTKLNDLSQCDSPPLHTYTGVDFINLTLSSCWQNMSLEDLQKLANILFADQNKCLTHIRVDSESFCVTWLAPKGTIHSLTRQAKKQERLMKQVGIVNLTIGQEIVFQQTLAKAEIVQKVLNNALVSASIDGDVDKASILLSLGADPNCFAHTGVTPLMLACKQGETGVTELLLKSNAEIDHANDNGNTALMAASSAGHPEIVKMLIAYNANPHIRGSSNHTALSIAALRNHREVVSLLLWINANPNIQTENGWTPLMYAASHGDVGMVKALLRCNADIDTARTDGNTAILDATENGHTEVIRLIKVFKIFNRKVLEESPSPNTLCRRRSIPLSLNNSLTDMRSRKGSIGLPSFHSSTMYPVSHSPVPRSIFRPTAKRSISFHSNTKSKLSFTRKR